MLLDLYGENSMRNIVRINKKLKMTFDKSSGHGVMLDRELVSEIINQLDLFTEVQYDFFRLYCCSTKIQGAISEEKISGI